MKAETIYQPQSNTPIFASIVTATGFTAANPGTAPTNTVLVASSEGVDESIIRSLTVASDDSSSRTIQWWFSPDEGTTKYLLGITLIAALSGSATLVNVDVLHASTMAGLELDENLQPIIRLPYNATTVKKSQLYAAVITAAVTASKTLWITGSQSNMAA